MSPAAVLVTAVLVCAFFALIALAACARCVVLSRRLAEQASFEPIGEERLEAILDEAGIGLWTWNLTTNQTSVSSAHAALYGRTRHELMEKPESYREAVHEEDRKPTEDTLLNALENGDSYRIEHRVVHTDGSVRWLENRGRVERDEAGHSIRVDTLSYDITERKLAEDALRASEERFATAFRVSPDGIMLTAISEQRVREINEAFTRITGYERDELVGRPPLGLDFWDDPEEWQESLHLVREEGRFERRIYQFRRKNGEVFAGSLSCERVEIAGSPFLVSLLRDVTEQEDARRRQMLLTAVMEATTDLIAMSTPSSRIIYLNRAGRIMLGLPEEGDLGDLHIADLHPPDDLTTILETIIPRSMVGGHWSGEIAFRDRNGHPIPTSSVVLCHLDDRTGDPLISMIARDITEAKHFVRELEDKNAELERFTYTVSHDLKSPLITIRGFLGVLVQDALQGRTDRLEKDAKRIEGATERMQQLLEDLLEYARVGRQVDPSKEVDLNLIVQGTIEQLTGPLEQRKVKVVVNPLPTISFGDPIRLHEVFQNLIDNSVRYFGEQPDPIIEIGQRAEGFGDPDASGIGRVVLYVRDNGIGIDPEYHEKVFGLFDRIETGIDGTGVGLALVKRIVELHDGQIWVESEGRGHGTTFCFTLKA